MVLTKDELLSTLQNEVRLLLHLASKVDPAKLDYRPTAKQRTTLELLQYLTIMGPIHMRAAVEGVADMQEWGKTWNTQEAIAKDRSLEQVKESIGQQPGLFEEMLGTCSDADLRAEIDLFGNKALRASRGLWMVRLLLSNYAAYRMQLFLYLKASGREELNTMNLWVGMDGPMKAT